MRKQRRPSKALQARLDGAVRKSRRETLYRMLAKKHEGTVPCFVCGKHVRERSATLEHIVPTSLGGTDEMSNLTISHNYCNQQRGEYSSTTVTKIGVNNDGNTAKN